MPNGVGSFNLLYLRIPIFYTRITKSFWNPLMTINKYNTFEVWTGKKVVIKY